MYRDYMYTVSTNDNISHTKEILITQFTTDHLVSYNILLKYVLLKQ
jgi:hypothetical protein